MKLKICTSKSGKRYVYLGSGGLHYNDGYQTTYNIFDINKRYWYFDGGFHISRSKEGLILVLCSNKHISEGVINLASKRRPYKVECVEVQKIIYTQNNLFPTNLKVY